MPTPGEHEVLVRTLHLSIDPGQRTWMRAEGSYRPPLVLGQPMPGGILGEVVESRIDTIAPGQWVSGMGEWANFCVIQRSQLRRIDKDPAIPPLAQMSVLGATGWTAYVGLMHVGRPKPDEVLVVSAASGAVGSLAGQIGRIHGCRVIGIAGSSSKCDWLTKELGFTAAIDYGTEDVARRIDALCPNGVDLYFENVGGKVGEAIYPRLATNGRVVLCGLVANYRDGGKTRLDLSDLLMKRVRVESFVITDHFDRIRDANAALAGWLRDGSLRYHVEIVEGLENAVAALESLLQPGNSHRGKLMVKVASL